MIVQYEEKPILPRIHDLKRDADVRGKTINKLLLTTSEFKQLKDELSVCTYHFHNPKKDINTIFGIPFEVLDDAY